MIDFRCEKCGKLLRAPADAGGKQSRCPQCENVQTIPAASTAQAASSPFAGPPPGSPGANPFAAQMPQGSPFADPTNPYAAPAAYGGIGPATTTGWSVESGPIVPTKVALGDILSQAWRIYAANLWQNVAVGLTFITLLVGTYATMFGAMFSLGMRITNTPPDFNPSFAMLPFYAGSFIIGLGFLWLLLGIVSFYLQLARGNCPAMTEIFTGGRFFLQGLGAMLILYVVNIVGMVLLATATLIGTQVGTAIALSLQIATMMFSYTASAVVTLLFLHTLPLIVDRRPGVMAALRGSLELTRINVLTLFLFGIVGFIIYMAGFMACFVGSVFAIPFLLIAWIVSYLLMSGQPTVASYPPPPGH